MKVLALDIAATASGAAFDGPNGRPAFSTLAQKIDGDAFGPVGTKFRRWMVDLIALAGPSHITFEAPWVPSGDRQASRPTPTRIPRMLLGLAFLAEQIADEFEIACSEAAVSTVRKHFVGHGRPDDPKKTVMHRCRLLQWPVKNDHEADAAALWAFAKAQLDPKWNPGGDTVLFGRGAA